MRGVRSLLVLLVLAAGLGAYIYFVEAERDLSDPESRKDKVFAVETGKIEEIEIKSPNGDTTVKRKGDTWEIVSPVTAAADDYAMSSIVSALETLEIQRNLQDDPGAVGQYGLDPARISVAFKATGDATPHRLNIGNKTPTGSDLYARLEGQPRLFLIAAHLEDTLSRSTFDLREKSVLKFERDKIDAIRLTAAGAPPVTLSRTSADWNLTAPVTARADASAVDAIINRAASATFKGVVAGEPSPATDADFRKYGLDKPRFVIELGAGSTRASLAIGSALDDSSVYARDVSKPVVVTVDASLLNDLRKTAGDLRVKDVFGFKPYTALGLQLTSAGTTTAFEKAKTGTDAAEAWKQTAPEARDVNQTGMTDLLNTLSALRADSFVATAPAAGQDLVVVARYGDAAKPTEERITLRKSGTTVHAMRANEPGAAVVPSAEFDKVMTQLKELTGSK